jgi:Resolvase, N terminal domain/Recombinase
MSAAAASVEPTGVGEREDGNHVGLPERPERKSSLELLRETINVELLRSEIERLLLADGRDLAEWQDWPPVLAQVRISSADTKWKTMSASPERQVKHLARYCVEYSLGPQEMCFEAQSGSLTDLKPRRLFERYYERIERGELNIVAVITYNIDRFTRDRFIGEKWLRMLKAHGIDLHETDEMDPPLPLAEREQDYAMKLFGAWRESKRASKRIKDVRRDRHRSDRLFESVNHYGHKPVYETHGNRQVQARGIIVPAEAEVLQEATRRIHDGEALNSVVTDLNERGLRGRYGGLWHPTSLRQLLTSPRLAGLQNAEGTLVRRDIEPILDEEQWLRNCELLARAEAPPGPQTKSKRWNGDMFTCAVCGSPLQARSNGRGNVHYLCSRPELRGLRRCQCESRRQGCTCGRGEVTHACRNARLLDEFLLEVAFTAVAAAPENAPGSEDSASSHADVQRERLQTELLELDIQRRDLARRQRQQVATNEATGDESDAALREIVTRSEACRQELAVLERHAAHAPRLHGTTQRLRARARADEGFARELVREVIDHCTVEPRDTGYGAPYSGITVFFNEPYGLAEDELQQLRERLNAGRARELRRARPWPQRSTREDGELAFELYQRGRTASDIAGTFNQTGRPTQRGSGRWLNGDIESAIRRICDEHDIPYERRPTNRRSRFSYEARHLVYELASNPDRDFADIVPDIKQMRVQSPAGKPWSAQMVRECYVVECRRRGEPVTPRTSSRLWREARAQRQARALHEA